MQKYEKRKEVGQQRDKLWKRIERKEGEEATKAGGNESKKKEGKRKYA